MARRKEGGIGATATMHRDTESSALTFAALDARIEALPKSPSNLALVEWLRTFPLDQRETLLGKALA